MSYEPTTECPNCGSVVAPDDTFCPECGQEIVRSAPPSITDFEAKPVTAESSIAATTPEVVTAERGRDAMFDATASSYAHVPHVSYADSSAENNAQYYEANQSGFSSRLGRPTIQLPPERELPFVFEWDRSREFIERTSGNFAWRIRFLCGIDQGELAISVNGTPVPLIKFGSVRRGDTRTGLIPLFPEMVGRLSVSIGIDVRYDNHRTIESFVSESSVEHPVWPMDRYEVKGGNVNINIQGNTGIIRQDDMRMAAPIVTDRQKEMENILNRSIDFHKEAFTSSGIRHESIRLSYGERELLVVRGEESITFGRRGEVRLSAEDEYGNADEMRNNFISGVHFTVFHDKATDRFYLVDGGETPSKHWKRSTNGITIQGKKLEGKSVITPGRAIDISLAPYAIEGGSLNLSLSASGYEPYDTGCDRAGNVSHLILRDRAHPTKAVLVVWGEAGIDEVLGTASGCRVASVKGRLHLVGAGGAASRFYKYSGGTTHGGIRVQ